MTGSRDVISVAKFCPSQRDGRVAGQDAVLITAGDGQRLVRRDDRTADVSGRQQGLGDTDAGLCLTAYFGDKHHHVYARTPTEKLWHYWFEPDGWKNANLGEL
jgi:hypothetical protein